MAKSVNTPATMKDAVFGFVPKFNNVTAMVPM